MSICAESKTCKHAIGLLQGRRYRSTPHEHAVTARVAASADYRINPHRDVYEAVILCHALEEIQMMYPQLVGGFERYFQPGKQGPRPPSQGGASTY